MSTLTTANSILMLKIEDLYPVPVPISGYAVDDAFATDEVKSSATMMGFCGIFSAGFTPFPVLLSFNLLPDILFAVVFDTWIGAERKRGEVYVASATILIQGTGALYTFKRGFLGTFSIMPDAKKILQPRKFTITFEEMSWGPA